MSLNKSEECIILTNKEMKDIEDGFFNIVSKSDVGDEVLEYLNVNSADEVALVLGYDNEPLSVEDINGFLRFKSVKTPEMIVGDIYFGKLDNRPCVIIVWDSAGGYAYIKAN